MLFLLMCKLVMSQEVEIWLLKADNHLVYSSAAWWHMEGDIKIEPWSFQGAIVESQRLAAEGF